MPISIASVRLVYPMTNPDTGVTRDTVINQLKAVPPNMQSPNMSLDRWQFGKKWDRVVPGLNVVIPWPEVEVPEFETMAADTVREQVEDRSFYYGLLSPPMPEQVVDELRNKFSRFRTRHEAWYIEKKEIEEALKKGRQETIKAMQTPLDEFHEKNRKLARSKESRSCLRRCWPRLASLWPRRSRRRWRMLACLKYQQHRYLPRMIQMRHHRQLSK